MLRINNIIKESLRNSIKKYLIREEDVYAKKSGVLPFRKNENNELEFLLGLPGEPIEPHKRIPGFYGTWDIFKGHTEGQDVRTAAIREFSEETGLSPNLIRDDNFYDLGFCGKLYTYALDVTDCDIDENSLHSNEVHSKHGYKPFPEIGKYSWFKLPITVSVRKSAVMAMEKITQIIGKEINNMVENKHLFREEKKDLTILWLDDNREPYSFFDGIEQQRKKNQKISKSSLRTTAFYNNNIFNQYNVKFDWVRNFDEFKKYILTNGLPEFVSFDRDLKQGNKIPKDVDYPDGVKCANWFREYCESTNQKMPTCFVHSANKKRVPEIEAILGSAALKQVMENRKMKNKLINEIFDEMQAQHISPFDFDQFKLDASTWASGEKSGISHGFGIYVAIDPYSGGRYVKSAIKDNKDNPQAIFYDVDIPDFNGHNYILMHGAMDREDYDRINAIFKQTFGTDIDLHETDKAKRGGLLNGFNVMDCIDETINNLAQNGSIDLGVDRKSFFKGKLPTNYSAAKFLNEKCGYVGGMYNGNNDRMCAFIFDPSLIKINKKVDVKDIIDIQPFKSDKDRDRYKKAFNNSDFYKERLKNITSNSLMKIRVKKKLINQIICFTK